MIMSTTNTPQSLKKEYQLTDYQLKQNCSKEHLEAVAKDTTNFMAFAQKIPMPKGILMDIKTDPLLDFPQKSRKVFLWWKSNCQNPTYQRFVKICLSIPDGESANTMCTFCKTIPNVTDVRKVDTTCDSHQPTSGKKDAYCSANFWNIPPQIHETAGEGVLIAVLDTGINPDHAIFQEKQTPKKIACLKNFVPADKDKVCETVPAFDQDLNCHGTAVASIIAGQKMSAPSTFSKMFNLQGKTFAVGVAPKASLVVCRVSYNGVQAEWVNKALQWIIDHNNVVLRLSDEELRTRHKESCELDHEDKRNKIPVVNMSFKFDTESQCGDMEELILKLKKQKVVCVAGCGNDYGNKDPGYPACFQNVLSVGAADYGGRKCSFSSEPHVETDIDVYALGKDVIVAKTSKTYIEQKVVLKKPAAPVGPMPPPPPSTSTKASFDDKKGTFETDYGTSFATPAVCGLIAIIVQYARKKDISDDNKIANVVTDITQLKKLITKHLFNENENGSLKKLLQQQSVENFLSNIELIDALLKSL